MITKSEILILIPAFNEERTISEVISKVQELGFSNILVVNDGSRDNTADVVTSNNAKLVSHIINRGPGAATQTGIKYARANDFKALITIDADGQHEATDLDKLVNAYNEGGSDLVIGSRFLATHNKIPLIRKVWNSIANIYTFLFCGNWITDSQSGLKLIGEKAISDLEILTDGYEFCSEMVIKSFKLGLVIKEVPVSVYYTELSMQKGQNFLTGITTAFNLVHRFIFRDF